MSEMEPFEQRLKRQPLRQAPAAWREGILAAAREAESLVAQTSKSAVSRASKPASRPHSESLPIWKSAIQQVWKPALQRLASLLWPHPAAWGGLAAIWVFIFAMNFSMRDQTPAVAEKVSPPSPEMIAELKQQQRLLAELIGVNDAGDADRPKVIKPAPRSERVVILAA